MKLHMFLIFISILKSSIQLEIHPDNTKNGLIFIPSNTINLKENDKIFQYKFNVSALQQILMQETELKNYCPLNTSFITPLEVEIEYNVKWNNFNPVPKNKSLNAKIIYMNFFYNNILLNYIEKLDLKQGNICENMNRLTHYFNKMNNELNKLSNSNTTSIEEVLSLNDIANEIDNFLKSSSVYVLPFNLISNHVFDTEEFFKQTNFNFYYENYIVTLEFEIPIFRRSNLFSVYMKPIIRKNTPYLMHTDIKYAAFSSNRPIFYTNNSFANYCFYKLNTFYCKRPNDEDQYACETQMFSSKIRKTCLERLPRKNMITQIQDTLYCNVFESMILRVNCNDIEYLLRVSNHSKITNKFNCFINNSFYEYNPENQSNKYEIFSSNTTGMYESIFFETKIINFWDLYLTISYLALLALTYIITILVGIYKWNQKLENEKNAENNSEQHAYATVDYYV